VEPQADAYNKAEKFNIQLFQKLGNSNGLGLLGLTVPEEYGGCGLDASAVVLVHEELSYADPAFCLSYLAHAILLVHNLATNASSSSSSSTQLLERLLPDLISGNKIGGMGMSEASSGTDVLGMKTVATTAVDGGTCYLPTAIFFLYQAAL
jgi:isovaleryl-CoA dehydrogenase